MGSATSINDKANSQNELMSPPACEIWESRLRAAKLSGGVSSEAIHSMICRVVEAKELRGKVLDFGAGVGDLTRRLLAMKRFDHVAAADIVTSPADLEGAVEWTVHDLNVTFPGHDSAFDVVVASEVIEHLENPRFVMREIYRILRPGGTVLVSTPNNESWRSLLSLMVRGHYVAFCESSYPAHIVALLRQDLSRIFSEAKLALPEFYYTGEGGIPCKPSITWQRISFNFLKGRRFSDNILAVANKPTA